MKKLIVIGAGGHARSVLDIVLNNRQYKIIGCIDNVFPHKKNVENMKDIPIIGTDECLQRYFNEGIKYIFVAIGDNSLRKKLMQYALDIGFELVNIISKSAIISTRAILGKGICVMPGAVININCVVGNGCVINTNCSLDHDCTLGEYCHIAPGVSLSGSVTVGEGTQIGTGSSVINKKCIGRWSFIGAGSVVVRNIDDNVLAYGVPARIVKRFF